MMALHSGTLAAHAARLLAPSIHQVQHASPAQVRFSRALCQAGGRRHASRGFAASPVSAAQQNPEAQAHQPSTSYTQGPAPSKRQKKARLDDVCMSLAPHLSRNIVQSYILQGKVRVDGRPVVKAGTAVPITAHVDIDAEEPKYVCRAGHKLEAALAAFGVDPSGLVCLDSGVSTGGFTDCLLQHGAAHVFGIDVAYGQVANKVRQSERVTLLERFNVRHLSPEHIPPEVDLATLDLSFISVLKVLPAVVSVMRGCSQPEQPQLQERQQQQQQLQQQQQHHHQYQQLSNTPQGQIYHSQQEQQQGTKQQLGMQQQPVEDLRGSQLQGEQHHDAAVLSNAEVAVHEGRGAMGLRPPPQLLVLVKPQFEAGRSQVCSGGVVRDPEVHLEVLTRVVQGVEALGFGCQGIIESPLKGDRSGNTEFLAHFVRSWPTRKSEIGLLTLAGHKELVKQKEVAGS